MVWPNPEDPEGRARFVHDDPTEAYFWKSLEETGRASVQAINRAAELVGRDLHNFAQIWAPNPFGIFCLFFWPFLLISRAMLPRRCLWPRPTRSQSFSAESGTCGRPCERKRLLGKWLRGSSLRSARWPPTSGGGALSSRLRFRMLERRSPL